MNGQQLVLEALRFGLKPKPRTTVWEWADEHREIPDVAGPEPGRWRTSRTPFLREIMYELSPASPAEEIVCVKCSQIGATECLCNAIGFIIDRAPGPSIMLQPTDTAAKNYSKQRLAPTIRSTDVLREKVNEVKIRDSGNTIMLKEFPGGFLMLTGANSPVGLASTPAGNLFLDEIDRYPADVGGEGDPVKLIEARADNFPGKKIAKFSTPTVKGGSRIWAEWLRSDQRKYHVPCVFCGAMQPLEFGRLKWEKDVDGKHLPETVMYECRDCGQLIPERYKTDMLEAGVWVKANPDSNIPGFHINALYKPLGWKSWSAIVAQFLDAKEDPAKMKVFMNTVLGELWEEKGEAVDAIPLMERREDYGRKVPMQAGLLVAGIDVQGDGLEVIVIAWGERHESWTMEWTQIPGDPIHLEVWDRLDQYLRRVWVHEAGAPMRIEAIGIDTGGHHTEQVYSFVRKCRTQKSRDRLNIFALKGLNDPTKPVIGRPTRTNKYRIPLYGVGTIATKDAVMARLRNENVGPGYMHFPMTVEEEYFKQLTGQKVVTRYKGNFPARVYIKNYRKWDVFDATRYNLAALTIFNISQSGIVKRLEKLHGYSGPEIEVQEEAPDLVLEEAKGTRQRTPRMPRKNFATQGTSFNKRRR